jgi:hypothetical protein
LFKELWRPLARAGAGIGSAPPFPARSSAAGQPSAVYSRHSNGLEQFFGYIQGEPGLTLLDLSGASQANVGFITSLGHRLYSEDLLQTLDAAFGDGDFYSNQALPERIERFLEQTLNFPEDHFDGALVWDVLEYLSPPLLKAVAGRLHRIIKPRSYLLAIFHADGRAEQVASYAYRISDARTLLLAPRGARQPAQLFNNRAVEKLFQSFESVKFFLTRDHLREVIVKR